MKDLAGKVAWITGGGSGIGRALAVELARRGAHVAVSGRRVEKLEETVAQVVAAGGEALSVPCDVLSEEALAGAVAQVVAAYGGLDVAIANAGFGLAAPSHHQTVQDWRRQLGVNVFGAVGTVQAALPELLKTGGRIGLMGSVAAMVTYPSGAAYAASKAAIGSYGEGLYLDLKGTGVSCTTLHPGFVESEIAQVDNQGNFRADWKDKRPKAIMWTADRAARAMVNALVGRKRRKVITGHGLLADWLMRLCPSAVYRLMRTFAVRGS